MFTVIGNMLDDIKSLYNDSILYAKKNENHYHRYSFIHEGFKDLEEKLNKIAKFRGRYRSSSWFEYEVGSTTYCYIMLSKSNTISCNRYGHFSRERRSQIY